MKLVRLVLDNVRCFAHLELSFERDDEQSLIIDRTIIYGDNDSGKSTILQSIALVMAGSSALGELIGKSEDWIKDGEKSALISAWFKTEEGDIRHLELRFKRGISLTKTLLNNRQSLKSLDSALQYTSRNYAFLSYGVHRRVGSQNSKQNNPYDNLRAESSSTLFNVNAALFPFEIWIKQLHGKSDKSVIKELQKSIKKLIPNILSFSYNIEERGVYFKLNNDRKVLFKDLSYSVQVGVNWIADIYYRISTIYKDYKDPLDASFVLLVDEIDLYFHPSKQRDIVKSLCDIFKNMQLITTSHSPFVIEDYKNSEYVISINDKLKVNMPKRSDSIYPKMMPMEA